MWVFAAIPSRAVMVQSRLWLASCELKGGGASYN